MNTIPPNFSHTLTFTCEGKPSDSTPQHRIVFTVHGDSDLSQLIGTFENYLRACGYCFNGELAIVVNTEDEQN